MKKNQLKLLSGILTGTMLISSLYTPVAASSEILMENDWDDSYECVTEPISFYEEMNGTDVFLTTTEEDTFWLEQEEDVITLPEEAKEVSPLDENQKDSQGVYYALNSSSHIATVGKYNVSSNGSQYSGANDGVCIIPEKVSYNGQEYVVKKIESNAFYGNLKIKELYISDTVENIGQYFCSGSTLKKIYIGSGATSVSTWGFSGSEYLKEIKVSPDNPSVLDIDGVLFKKDMSMLIYYPPLRDMGVDRTYVIPDGVGVINLNAFANSKLKKVVLPASVKTIGQYAFDGSYIEEIDLTNVTAIDYTAFRGCQALRSIKLPSKSCTLNGAITENSIEGVCYSKGMSASAAINNCNYLRVALVETGTTAIAANAFSKCPKLETVIIPDTVTIMKSNCFSKCTSLKKIYIPSSVSVISDGVLSETNATIYGEAGSQAEAFATANGFAFENVEAHNHINLDEKIHIDNPYMTIKSNFCSICGYGSNASIAYKDGSSYVDTRAQAMGFDLSKTKVVQDVNEDSYIDGIRYSYYVYGSSMFWDNIANISKIDDGVAKDTVVLPEMLRKDGEEYLTDAISANAFSESERLKRLIIPDTVRTIKTNGLASTTLNYLYLGANVTSLKSEAFGLAHNIKYIYVSPKNVCFYVKDKALYNIAGDLIYDFSDHYEEPEGELSGTEATTEMTTETMTETTSETTTEATTESSQETISQEPLNIVPVSGVSCFSRAGKNIVVSWNLDATYTKYAIYRSTKEKTGYKQIAVVKSPVNTYTDETASNYVTYYYKVRGTYKQGTGSKVGPFSNVKSYVVSSQKKPSLIAEKKKLSSGQKYVELTFTNNTNTKPLIYVKKGTSTTYQKVDVGSSPLKTNKSTFKIGYNKNEKMVFKVRTYRLHDGKKYYSDFSNTVTIKP